jgi:hypothetical protein
MGSIINGRDIVYIIAILSIVIVWLFPVIISFVTWNFWLILLYFIWWLPASFITGLILVLTE